MAGRGTYHMTQILLALHAPKEDDGNCFTEKGSEIRVSSRVVQAGPFAWTGCVLGGRYVLGCGTPSSLRKTEEEQHLAPFLNVLRCKACVEPLESVISKRAPLLHSLSIEKERVCVSVGQCVHMDAPRQGVC